MTAQAEEVFPRPGDKQRPIDARRDDSLGPLDGLRCAQAAGLAEHADLAEGEPASASCAPRAALRALELELCLQAEFVWPLPVRP